jgi:voltage-gated potassium channel
MGNSRRKQIVQVGQKVRQAPRPNPIERRMSKFLREPPSIRIAASVIVTATALIVVGGGILIRVLDHSEYPNIWVGMWWALQTVTTVGYGDVTPTSTWGRVLAGVVMITGIGFLTVVTAAITAALVEGARRRRGGALGDPVEAKLDEVSARLERLELLLRSGEGSRARAADPPPR